MRWCAVIGLMAIGFALTGCGKGNNVVPEETGPAREVKTVTTQEGSGAAAEKGDHVFVRYQGRLADGGKVFDENKEGAEPFNFQLGSGAVIKGWDEGLVGAKVGEKRTLEIPWQMAYGAQGSPPTIPARADLIFDVEVVHLIKAEDIDVVSVKILEEGSGREVKTGDTVTIKFSGKTLGGREVASSASEPGGVLTFPFGEGRLKSRGLEASVEGMKVGEKRRVTLPPRMAYADGPEAVPALQVFEVELVKIN